MNDSETLDLFPGRWPPWMEAPETRIERRFKAFHDANPHILREMERRAFRLLKAGRSRIGVKAIWEAMRYDWAVRTQAPDFKCNNDYTALYARLLIHRHPELEQVIETRERRERRSA